MLKEFYMKSGLPSSSQRPGRRAAASRGVVSARHRERRRSCCPTARARTRAGRGRARSRVPARGRHGRVRWRRQSSALAGRRRSGDSSSRPEATRRREGEAPHHRWVSAGGRIVLIDRETSPLLLRRSGAGASTPGGRPPTTIQPAQRENMTRACTALPHSPPHHAQVPGDALALRLAPEIFPRTAAPARRHRLPRAARTPPPPPKRRTGGDEPRK